MEHKEEVLTISELQQMDGEPVWVEEVNRWGLVIVETCGYWANIPFVLFTSKGASSKFTYNVKQQGLHCFRQKV